MIRMRLLAILAVCVSSGGCEEDHVWVADIDQLEVVPITQVKRELPSDLAAGEGSDTFRYVVWDQWRCEVKWNQRCGIVETVSAPAGWQLCKPVWGVVKRGRGNPTWLVTLKDDWKAEYVMTVTGSRAYHEQWGSMIQVDEIGMELIRAGASPARRAAAGCIEPGVVTGSLRHS